MLHVLKSEVFSLMGEGGEGGGGVGCGTRPPLSEFSGSAPDYHNIWASGRNYILVLGGGSQCENIFSSNYVPIYCGIAVYLRPIAMNKSLANRMTGHCHKFK